MTAPPETPPTPEVEALFEQMGIKQDRRVHEASWWILPQPPSATPSTRPPTSLPWRDMLALVGRWAIAWRTQVHLQQTPWWKSTTFYALLAAFMGVLGVAFSMVGDPEIVKVIPEPWNKMLPLAVALIGPQLAKWWKDYRELQEAELAKRRRDSAGLDGGPDDGTPPAAPALPPPPAQ